MYRAKRQFIARNFIVGNMRFLVSDAMHTPRRAAQIERYVFCCCYILMTVFVDRV